MPPLVTSSPNSNTFRKTRKLDVPAFVKSSAAPPSKVDPTRKSLGGPTHTRTGSGLSMRSVFSSRASNVSKDKDDGSEYMSSGTDVPKKPLKAPSRFGFGLGRSTAGKSSLGPRSTPSPTTPNSSKTRPFIAHTPLARGASLPNPGNASPATQTPSSFHSIASRFGPPQDSPGALNDPAIKQAAATSLKIMDLQAHTSLDMVPPGDISFASTVDPVAEEDEEGNVSALLPVDFGAPTPAFPRIMVRRSSNNDLQEDEDEDDIDDDHDDDPTVFFQHQTPSRPSKHKPRLPGPAKVNGLPNQHQLGYLAPTAASNASAQARRTRTPSGKSRRVSQTSVSSASRRSSAIRSTRGSLMSYETILERSKEFSDVDELGMISTIALGSLGALSPGFGTPMYQRLSFGASTATMDSRQSRSRPPSFPPKNGKRSSRLSDVVPVNGSDAGSAPPSARLPPETPSPLGLPGGFPVSRRKQSPALALSSLKSLEALPSVNRMKNSPTSEKMRRELEAQSAELKALKEQLARLTNDLESKDSTIETLQRTQATLLAEQEEFSLAKSDWQQQESAWASRELEWEAERLQHDETARARQRLDAEKGLKNLWAAISNGVETDLQRIQNDRNVLQLLLGELDLWQVSSLVPCSSS